jgi:hypothetical protein
MDRHYSLKGCAKQFCGNWYNRKKIPMIQKIFIVGIFILFAITLTRFEPVDNGMAIFTALPSVTPSVTPAPGP